MKVCAIEERIRKPISLFRIVVVVFGHVHISGYICAKSETQSFVLVRPKRISF